MIALNRPIVWSIIMVLTCAAATTLGATGDPKPGAVKYPAVGESLDRGILLLLDGSSSLDSTSGRRLKGRILLTLDPYDPRPQELGSAPTTRPTTFQGYVTLDLAGQPEVVWGNAYSGAPTTQPGDSNGVLQADRILLYSDSPTDLLAKYYVNLNIADDHNAAYLGVGVESPGDSLRSQLSLPDGAGLVVNYVDDNGPSKEAIQKHDVLQKLDDQILVNAEQLVTLVRMHKAGEIVTLTLLRHASPRTERITLGRKQAMDSKQGPEGGISQLKAIPYLGRLYESGTEAHSPITFNDGELLASLDDHGELLALDIKSGKTLFHGRLTGKEQWDQIPELVRKKLESWRDLIAARQQPGNQ